MHGTRMTGMSTTSQRRRSVRNRALRPVSAVWVESLEFTFLSGLRRRCAEAMDQSMIGDSPSLGCRGNSEIPRADRPRSIVARSGRSANACIARAQESRAAEQAAAGVTTSVPATARAIPSPGTSSLRCELSVWGRPGRRLSPAPARRVVPGYSGSGSGAHGYSGSGSGATGSGGSAAALRRLALVTLCQRAARRRCRAARSRASASRASLQPLVRSPRGSGAGLVGGRGAPLALQQLLAAWRSPCRWAGGAAGLAIGAPEDTARRNSSPGWVAGLDCLRSLTSAPL